MEYLAHNIGNTIAGQAISYTMLFISFANVEASLRVIAVVLSIAASLYTIRKNRK